MGVFSWLCGAHIPPDCAFIYLNFCFFLFSTPSLRKKPFACLFWEKISTKICGIWYMAYGIWHMAYAVGVISPDYFLTSKHIFQTSNPFQVWQLEGLSVLRSVRNGKTDTVILRISKCIYLQALKLPTPHNKIKFVATSWIWTKKWVGILAKLSYL